MVRRVLGGLEALALPQRCPACAAPACAAQLLCEPCWSRIPRLGTPLCVRCLVAGRAPDGCPRHPTARAWVAWVYDERAALVVQALKYRDRPGLAPALGEAMAAALPAGLALDLVVEVPLHAARRRERGYNQAALLADSVARRLGVPRLPGALVRARPTRAQAGLGPAARRDNLEGAFRVREPRALDGRQVLIVDDVVTTGSTLGACLAELDSCGARTTAAALAWAQ